MAKQQALLPQSEVLQKVCDASGGELPATLLGLAKATSAATNSFRKEGIKIFPTEETPSEPETGWMAAVAKPFLTAKQKAETVENAGNGSCRQRCYKQESPGDAGAQFQPIAYLPTVPRLISLCFHEAAPLNLPTRMAENSRRAQGKAAEPPAAAAGDPNDELGAAVRCVPMHQTAFPSMSSYQR